MAKIIKPDLTRVWANSAPPSNIEDPGNSKYDLGWSLEAPSLQSFNYIQNRITQGLAYYNQSGIPEWDSTTGYYVGSVVTVSGNTYTSLTNTNIGNDPTSDVVNWSLNFGRNNILGPVSQVGGVPTGSLFETGSNASGDYSAYADGRLFMTLTPIANVDITTSVGTGGVFNIASPIAVTVPYTMAGGACVGFVNDINSPNVWGGVDYISPTSVQIQALFYQSLSGRTIVPTVFARWY